MDGGWSWVVLAASFVTNMLTIGFSYAIGVYYVEFLSVFNESKGYTALISSLNMGTLCGVGPAASLVSQRFGFRVTMLIGGIVAALGLFISSFATNLLTVIISFGAITGLGSGFAHNAAVVVISVYFKRLRPLALGISYAGIALGSMVFPWLTSSLLSLFGWRGALLFTSGLLLHNCICAMLIFKPVKKIIKDDFALDHNISANSLNTAQENDDTKTNFKSTKKKSTEDQVTMIPAQKMASMLFSNINFDLLLAVHMTFMFGLAVMYTHLLAFAKTEGISASLRSLMISVVGMASFLGRITLGALGQLPSVNNVVLYIAAILATGLSIFAICLWSSPVGMLFSSALFGFFSASVGPTLAESICLVTGTKLFGFGFGIQCFFLAFGWLLGAPAAGALFDATQHYPNSFYLGGGVTIFGALLLIPVAIRSNKNIVIQY